MADKYDPLPDLAAMLTAGIGYHADVHVYADRIGLWLGLREDDSAEVAAEALRKALGQLPPRTVTFDLADPDDRHVLTQALDDYGVKQAGLAADGDSKDNRTRWAAAARRFRDLADAVAG